MIWSLLFACHHVSDIDVHATVSEVVASVVTLNWSNPEPLSTYVRFGVTDQMQHQTPVSSEELDASVLLLGIPADSDIFYEVVNASDDSVLASGTTHNGTLPGSFSPLETEFDQDPGWSGYITTTSLGATTGPMILDTNGDYVWWFDEGDALPTSGMQLSQDRQSVLFIKYPSAMTAEVKDGELVRMSLDGSRIDRQPLPGIHHDFKELPDGSVLVLSELIGNKDGVDVMGDRLLKVADDGSYEEVWNIFEDWPEANLSTNTSDDTEHWDHANALDYDEASNSYLISFRNFSAIISVDADTRQTQWVLGGTLSDYEIIGGEQAQFKYQHQFELVDGGILVFDDGDPSRNWSRAIEYSLEGTTATKTWEYTTKPPIQSVILGDVHRLENGNTMVMFSVSGQIDVVNPAGQRLWRTNADLGYAMSYCSVIDSLYQ